MSTLGSPSAIKGEDFRVSDLTQSQKWPVGFGLSGEMVVWEDGDELWDGEDGDSPWVFYLLIWPWIGSWIVMMRIWICPW